MTRRPPGRTPSVQERYAVLLEIGRILTGTLRPDHLYRALYEQTARVLQAREFYISLYDHATDTATVVFHVIDGKVDRLRALYRGADSPAIVSGRPVLQRAADGGLRHMLWDPARPAGAAAVSAPMLRDGRVLGLITAHDDQDSFGSDDVELLAAVADLAAFALGNANHLEETERRRLEAERLEQIGRALTSSLEPGEVIDRVATGALELASTDTVQIWRASPDRVELVAALGDSSVPLGTTFPLPQEVRRRSVADRRALVLEDVATSPLIPDEARPYVNIRTAVAVPLIADDEVTGFLVVGRRTGPAFEHDGISLLERLGYQASIALANAHLHEEIRSLSLTDPLTGLPNRRHLEIVLEKEFAAAQRGRRLSIVLFDLDNFKRFNDTAGHPAGDEALCSFARILQHQTRAMNLAARYGGDEFICVLADADRRGGQMHAGRVAGEVADHTLLHRIGVSAGIATYNGRIATPAQLIRAADRDLYRQKEHRPRGIPAS